MYQSRAIAAGIAIGLAGLLNLSLGGGIPGAIAFGLGLLVVCGLQLDLFTGKIRALYEREVNWKQLIIIYLGNVMGIFFMYCFGTALPNYPMIKQTAIEIMASRAQYGFGFMLIRGIVCGICIQMACDLSKKHKQPILAAFPAIAFVILGGTHCVADMLYVFYSDAFKQGLQILETLVGNVIGAFLFVIATTDRTGRTHP